MDESGFNETPMFLATLLRWIDVSPSHVVSYYSYAYVSLDFNGLVVTFAMYLIGVLLMILSIFIAPLTW